MKSTRELNQKGIKYRLVKHSGSAHTAEEAAEEIGLEVSQIVKSIFLIDPEDHGILILISGGQKIDLKKVKTQSGFKKIDLASKEEVLKLTGYPVGLVTPFGLTKPFPIYIDGAVLNFEEVGISSGFKGYEIILDPNDLILATHGMVGDFKRNC